MPTHIHNSLEILGLLKQIKEVKEFLKGNLYEDRNPMYIDFNNIIKMPEELKITHNTEAELAQFLIYDSDKEDELVKEAQKKFDKLDRATQRYATELASKYEKNYQRYGHTTWYSWSYENWKTKLNAYQQQMPKENIIWFDTANNHVTALIIRVSKKFPKVKFHYSWEAECGGPDGIFNIKNGDVVVPKNKARGPMAKYNLRMEKSM